MHTFVGYVLAIIFISAAIWLYMRARRNVIRRIRLDQHDVARARDALAEPGSRPWHQVREELGLDEEEMDRAERGES